MVLVGFLLTSLPVTAQSDSAEWPPIIERRLPPVGLVLPAENRERWEQGLADFSQRAEKLGDHERLADAEVFAKALRYAIDHREFYAEKELATGDKTLALALERLAFLEKGETPWAEADGLLVRGYRSAIDGSVQPYGLHVPEGIDKGKPAPLLIWLHGRGDKITDLHFIQRCLAKNSALGGHFDVENVITVHPFGRQCVGWKHAGEIDVLEVLEEMKKRYSIDEDRVVLAGFSMGGAGAWHIGAHYADQFCAVHAGAGFAETALYNKLTPEQYPSQNARTLWGLYDVPNYTRNLFNLPVIAYSGEDDKQKQAADVMAASFAEHGHELPHLIGPGMGHKYHPETAKEVQAFLLEAIHRGRNKLPAKVTLQTQTLRYSSMHWLRVNGLEEHWQDSRVDAEMIDEGLVNITTKNVSRLWIERDLPKGAKIFIDEMELSMNKPSSGATALTNLNGQWSSLMHVSRGPKKTPGFQGPIDDAFMAPFLVVAPSGTSGRPKVQRWVDFELAHFLERWKALMRGEVRVKKDSEVTAEDIEKYNLILWGDPKSNSQIAEVIADLPLVWTGDKLLVAGELYDAEEAVPTLIYPNPKNPTNYIVINSGLTFREDHDRTNSLQNPKLPDWAVIDLSRAPDGTAPGEILAADFFDERWQVKKEDDGTKRPFIPKGQ